MIHIKYSRFVTEPNTWKGLVGLKIEQMKFHVETDHNNNYLDNQTSYEKCIKAAEAWLENHYGYVTIDVDTETGSINYSLGNKSDFIKEFLYQGVQLIEVSL